MAVLSLKKQPSPSRPTVRRATVLTAALGLLLACSGGGEQVEERTGRVVETCGGACMGGPKPDQGLCVECPPREWTCD